MYRIVGGYIGVCACVCIGVYVCMYVCMYVSKTGGILRIDIGVLFGVHRCVFLLFMKHTSKYTRARARMYTHIHTLWSCYLSGMYK